MKKIIILLCAVLLLCTACGAPENNKTDNENESDSTEIAIPEQSPFGTYDLRRAHGDSAIITESSSLATSSLTVFSSSSISKALTTFTLGTRIDLHNSTMLIAYV